MKITKVFIKQSGNINGVINDRIDRSVFNFEKNKKPKAKCIRVQEQILLLLLLPLLGMTLLIMVTVVRAAPHAVSSDNNTLAVTTSINDHDVWPPMQHYDIWNDDDKHYSTNTNERHQHVYQEHDDDNDHNNDDVEMSAIIKQNLYENINSNSKQFLKHLAVNDLENNDTEYFVHDTKRQSKVIHLFPVPVDGECLSDDGRRTGSCFNAYECRKKGGEAKGECALGFGVCCIFIANCNETISNNITYLVSPSFPSFMPNNVTNCSLKIKLMNDDISQIRIDFYHFILGQPNRRTGVCDGDVFSVSGGPGGTLSLCGQNSGQHIYYDVGGRMLPRQTLYGSLRPLRYEDIYPGRNATNDTSMEIDIELKFATRFLPSRLWEIRIAQIPFSQRAPAGCLQYFTGTEGVFQTFNFADNGRHLANQNYRICMRQEVEMCSIVYQPCDEQSFRIGPSSTSGMLSTTNDQFQVMNGAQGVVANDDTSGVNNGMQQMNQQQMNQQQLNQQQMNQQQMNQPQMQIQADDTTNNQGVVSTTSNPLATSTMTSQAVSLTTTLASSITTPVSSSISESTTIATDTASSLADDPEPISSSPAPVTTPSAATESSTISTTSPPLSDDVEGSGGDADIDTNTRRRPTVPPTNVSRRPRPTRGGFDLLGFLRSAFDFGFRSSRQMRPPLTARQLRQFYSTCRDRITMPCIIEDFIGTGLGPLPGCEPVHCGMQFCSNGIWPCRVESTVTPFYVGIHFGDGAGKGSAEDNIGACLRYQQVQCM